MRRALRLVDLVADWLIPEVLTNQRQSLQETKHDAAQQGAGQDRTVYLWIVPQGIPVPLREFTSHSAGEHVEVFTGDLSCRGERVRSETFLEHNRCAATHA